MYVCVCVCVCVCVYVCVSTETLGGSRGMRDTPGNYLEQTLAIPNTGPLERECTNLRPGSVLYIPPGVLQCVAACCSVLQCVAVCCSVLQCVCV